MSNERTPLSVAEELYDAGYDPLVVPFGGKECFETGWTKMRITREGLARRPPAIAGRVVVRVKADYYETANIWVCSILESGERKTPVVLATRKPIQQWEKERIKAAEPEIATQESARRTLEARLRHLETEAARAPPAERSTKETEARKVAAELAAFKVRAKPRYLTDDCTPERLGMLLAENEERMAVLSDESTIFPMIFGRYSSAPNYEIYLKSYQGSPHPIDRGGRTGEILDEPLLTLGLSVQPEVIKELAAQPDARGRGLVGRFIYSRPQSLLGQRIGDAAPLDPALQLDYTERLRRLLALERVVVDGRSCAHTLQLSPEAYACWVRLHDALEEEMGRDGVRSLRSPIGQENSAARSCAWRASCTWPSMRRQAGRGTPRLVRPPSALPFPSAST